MEKIGLVGEKILDREIEMKIQVRKWMKKIGLVGKKIRGQKIDVKNSSRKIDSKNLD